MPALAGSAAAGGRADPKDKIADAEELKKAIALRRGGAHEQAIARFRKVLAANPQMVDGWQELAFSLRDVGRTAEAIAALDRAVKHAEIAAEGDPGQGFEVLAQLAMDHGDVARAADLAARSVQADDRREMSHFILGEVARTQGRY